MEIQLQIWRSILRELCLLRLKMESSRGIQEIPGLSWSVGESPLKERSVILDTEYRVNNGTNAWDWKHSVQRDLWVVWCCHPARPGAKKKLLSFSNLLKIWPESWSCQIHIVKSLPPTWLFWNGACKNRRKRQWRHKDGSWCFRTCFLGGYMSLSTYSSSTHTEVHKAPLLKAKKRMISRILPLFLRPAVCAILGGHPS